MFMSLELLLAFVLALVCSLWLWLSRRKECRRGVWGLPTHEWVAGLVLILLPELIILGSLLTVKVFVARYVLWSMIGASLFATSALFRMVAGNRTAAVIVLLPLLVWYASTITN